MTVAMVLPTTRSLRRRPARSRCRGRCLRLPAGTTRWCLKRRYDSFGLGGRCQSMFARCWSIVGHPVVVDGSLIVVSRVVLDHRRPAQKLARDLVH